MIHKKFGKCLRSIRRIGGNLKQGKDFKNNKSVYRKGRRAYFKAVEKAIAEFVNEGVEVIVKEMNALLPAAQREANKQAIQ